MFNAEKKLEIIVQPAPGKKSRTPIWAWAVLIIGMTLAFYFFTVIILASFDWGLFVPLLAAFSLGILGAVKVTHPETELLAKPKGLKIIIYLIIACLGVSFVIVEGLIIHSALAMPEKPADYVLVLGAGIRGEQVPPLLQGRLNQAQNYLQTHPDCQVIVSGGQGRGEAISEAEAMKRYLLQHGIKESRIIKEDRSTSTFENLKNTRAILIDREQEKCQLIIVSNDYHIFRIEMLTRRLGLKAEGLPCRTALIDIPHSYIREYLAVMKSCLMDK